MQNEIVYTNDTTFTIEYTYIYTSGFIYAIV